MTIDPLANLLSGGEAEGSRAPRVMQNRKVVVLTLCIDRQFTSQSTTYRYQVAGKPRLAGLGPHVEDVVAQAVGKDFSANFKYKIIGEKSVDGDTWEAFSSAVLAEQTTAAAIVGAAHTNRVDYANDLRFLIGVANASGTGTEVGTLSAWVALKFWS